MPKGPKGEKRPADVPYRLVAAVDFEKSIVWIKWVGAHADYGRIAVTKVDHHE